MRKGLDEVEERTQEDTSVRTHSSHKGICEPECNCDWNDDGSINNADLNAFLLSRTD